ncbi:phage tail protein, partial [Salmonella enterica subsp. enterica serovar Eko]|nr:phage tail protein [Salmonella enterica subsp. enterica serovar Eko]
MSAKFYTLLTEIGAAKLASAAALGVPLKITHMAVGDGGGVLPTPSAQQTALVAERRRAALNMLYIDPQNNSQIIAEQVIPETEGGWWIREVGLFDETGALIAVGNCPESYKPQLTEGSGRTQTVRMVLITSSTDNITMKIDPAVVLATRKYVDDKALELKVYVDDLMAKHLAAPDPHSQYAQKDSPTLTGIPKVPTPAAGNSTKQIANTEFVASSIAAMVDSAPAALDTLNELAAALGNDPNFATTMINALAGKQPLDNTLTNLSGKDIAGLLTYLGLGETAKQAAGAVQKTGDEMSGKLTLPQTSSFGVNTNNTLGGSSIAIGDNDTGLKGNGDGNLAF